MANQAIQIPPQPGLGEQQQQQSQLREKDPVVQQLLQDRDQLYQNQAQDVDQQEASHAQDQLRQSQDQDQQLQQSQDHPGLQQRARYQILPRPRLAFSKISLRFESYDKLQEETKEQAPNEEETKEQGVWSHWQDWKPVSMSNILDSLGRVLQSLEALSIESLHESCPVIFGWHESLSFLSECGPTIAGEAFLSVVNGTFDKKSHSRCHYHFYNPQRQSASKLPCDRGHSDQCPSDRNHSNQSPSDRNRSNQSPSDRSHSERSPSDIHSNQSPSDLTAFSPAASGIHSEKYPSDLHSVHSQQVGSNHSDSNSQRDHSDQSPSDRNHSDQSPSVLTAKLSQAASGFHSDQFCFLSAGKRSQTHNDLQVPVPLTRPCRHDARGLQGPHFQREMLA